MAANRRNSNKGSGSNAGTVFWLTAIVIVLFIFALNWGKVQETLSRTNFHEIVKTQTAIDAPKGAAQKPASPAKSNEKPTPKPDSRAEESDKDLPPQPKAAPKAGEPTTPKAEQSPVAKKADRPEAGKPDQTALPGKSSETKVQSPVSAQGGRSRPASLFFVRIDDDGIIVRQEVRRQVAVSDAPLLDSLAALLKGPSEDELRKKLVSLIPQGTKLLSAQVRGSTAFLNFNEAFMYNHYGIEGYAGQLKQVVYTATAFPTVQDVQILIEGQLHDYLGGEGVFIGKPLSRNSF
jgi:germination protein M